MRKSKYSVVYTYTVTFGAGLLEGILQIAQESLGIFMRS